jgi:hypothetical protein
MISEYFDLHPLSIDPERASNTTEASEASSVNIQLQAEPSNIHLQTELWEYSYVDISLCDYNFSQQEGISIIKFPRLFLEISWVEISLNSFYWLYNNLSFLSSEATQGKASVVADKRLPNHWAKDSWLRV